MSGILNIGVTGLRAAQAGMSTTTHNIANAGTPSYSRQEALQSAGLALQTGGGFLGQGTTLETVRRIYSDFLANRVLSTSAGQAGLDRLHASLARVDELLADPSAGLAPALDGFFSALSAAAANPADLPSRTALLGAAQALAGRFGMLDAELDALRVSSNGALEQAVSSINALARNLAEVNRQIVQAQASGHAPNDLLDRRDALLGDLAKEIGVTVVKRDDGGVNVFVGSGQPLVMGPDALQLATIASPEDPSRTSVALRTQAGTVPLPDNALTGGGLGGVLEFRNGTLDEVRNALGRIAVVLASEFNQQHRLGQTLSGAAGGAFFSAGTPQVLGHGDNSGTAVLAATVSAATALQASDYRLKYDGANYTLTRLSDGNQQTFAALPQTVDGVRISLSAGAAAAGDSFLVRAVAAGAGTFGVAIGAAMDVALAAPIRTAAGASNTGSGAISAGSVVGPPPVDANLLQTVTLTFTGAATFDVTGVGTGNPSGVAYAAGGTIAYNGWTLTLTGTPAAGDTFVIEANAGGAGDNRNGLALAALASSALVGGAATLAAAYGQAVARSGARTAEARTSAEAHQALAAQALRERESLSGVNLDEEAANLMRYQQAYQAAAKSMQLASELFDSILRLGGG